MRFAKRLTIKVVICLVLFSSTLIAADGDIETGVNEVRPDVISWELSNVLFLPISKTAKITYRKIGENALPTGTEKTILFRNVTDNPNTPENEMSTDFSQLITAINNGNSIKLTIANAVKIKLGI